MTSDLKRRIKEHSSGQCSSTKSKLPLKLVHSEMCQSRADARKLEKFYKSGKGRDKIKQLDARVAEWQTRRSQKPMGATP